MLFRKFLINIPTTKVRVLVSILLTVWTAYHVLEMNWMPNWEWLVFLAANSGIDIVQYAQNMKKPKVTESIEASTDVSELMKG